MEEVLKPQGVSGAQFLPMAVCDGGGWGGGGESSDVRADLDVFAVSCERLYSINGFWSNSGLPMIPPEWARDLSDGIWSRPIRPYWPEEEVHYEGEWLDKDSEGSQRSLWEDIREGILAAFVYLQRLKMRRKNRMSMYFRMKKMN